MNNENENKNMKTKNVPPKSVVSKGPNTNVAGPAISTSPADSDKANGVDSSIKYLGVGIIVVFAFVFGLIGGRIFDVGENLFDSRNDKVSFTGDLSGDEKVENVDFDLYWDVWEMMQSEYVNADAVDDKKMFYESIKGMVASYDDPANIFLDPEETKAFEDGQSGNFFSGIGAELGYNEGRVAVIAPIAGSPAEAAGLRTSDIIIAIDGEEIKTSDNIYDVVAKIRGEEGTAVTLTIVRKGTPDDFDVKITRGQITVPSMAVKYDSETKVATMDVSRFTESSLGVWQDKWDESVSEVIESGAESVVIDLRGNPGGYFDAAVYAAGEFLPKGTLVSQQKDRDGKTQDFEVNRNGRLLDIPVVVLINEGSASASEILAGALQSHDRVEIVGINSYGKGTAQQVIPFDDGSSIHITVLKWLLPDGTWINRDNPIKPDVKVEVSEEQFTNGEDPQMVKAYEILNK